MARKARVSYNTVSEIINLGREAKFAWQTVKRVKEAAEELGYSTNYFARFLKTGRTYLIGVSGLSPVILTRGFKNPYLTDVYQGIGEFFVNTEYKLIFHHYTITRQLGELYELARHRLVDGIIFILFSHKINSFLRYQARFLKEKNFPFIFTSILCILGNRSDPCPGK